MEWYLKVVRDNYANFSGRARRQEYWMFVLFNLIITFALAIVFGTLGALLDIPALFSLYVIYALAVVIPSLAVAVRRLHDVGKSGWFYLISLIPLIGGIWLIILFATEGDHGANAYGPDPKQEASNAIA
ncbi:DUF805 domain-containing protein [Winogradskyella arenosi]|uniref:Uncharacterized membrane protein YhaH (DUF805 family) n=1 Tax=Winogradskyella arenosi TaxID=533325 RepID=A0A368ZEG1_9FLAO|nr:DUF805 domain-containing protein [Winogradskyella arenosi]RCW91640.1 uncharacterized membrane protein YhaH (DUF805 family) [Winogradskyella arenosi]